MADSGPWKHGEGSSQSHMPSDFKDHPLLKIEAQKAHVSFFQKTRLNFERQSIQNLHPTKIRLQSPGRTDTGQKSKTFKAARSRFERGSSIAQTSAASIHVKNTEAQFYIRQSPEGAERQKSTNEPVTFSPQEGTDTARPSSPPSPRGFSKGTGIISTDPYTTSAEASGDLKATKMGKELHRTSSLKQKPSVAAKPKHLEEAYGKKHSESGRPLVIQAEHLVIEVHKSDGTERRDGSNVSEAGVHSTPKPHPRTAHRKEKAESGALGIHQGALWRNTAPRSNKPASPQQTGARPKTRSLQYDGGYFPGYRSGDQSMRKQERGRSMLNAPEVDGTPHPRQAPIKAPRSAIVKSHKIGRGEDDWDNASETGITKKPSVHMSMYKKFKTEVKQRTVQFILDIPEELKPKTVRELITIFGGSGKGEKSTNIKRDPIPSIPSEEYPQTLKIREELLNRSSKMITKRGGNIEVGESAMNIPRKALNSSEFIELILSNDHTSRPLSYIPVCPVLHCEPTGIEFSKPVIIKMKTWVRPTRGKRLHVDVLYKRIGWEKETTLYMSPEWLIYFRCYHFTPFFFGIRSRIAQLLGLEFRLRVFLYYSRGEERRFASSVCMDEHQLIESRHENMGHHYEKVFPDTNAFTVKLNDTVTLTITGDDPALDNPNNRMNCTQQEQINQNFAQNLSAVQYYSIPLLDPAHHAHRNYYFKIEKHGVTLAELPFVYPWQGPRQEEPAVRIEIHGCDIGQVGY